MVIFSTWAQRGDLASCMGFWSIIFSLESGLKEVTIILQHLGLATSKENIL
jgi:hypothetical protein